MGALPTGRKAGVALTDGSVSAMPGTDHEGVTALIKSGAEAIDTVRYGANHFNVKFLPSALEGSAGRAQSHFAHQDPTATTAVRTFSSTA